MITLLAQSNVIRERSWAAGQLRKWGNEQLDKSRKSFHKGFSGDGKENASE